MLLDALRKNLAEHQAEKVAGYDYPQAAVLLPITRSPEPRLLFTRRADHLNTHSGQVAFPGGKRDPEDRDLIATALREAEEEIALIPDEVEIIGTLGELISLHGIRVTPFVGLIPDNLALAPCEEELDAIFEVPVRWFFDDPRTHTDHIQVADQELYVPSYLWQEYRIWGLSAMMLVELLQVGFDQPVSLFDKPEGQLIQRPVRPFPPR
ncbi:8-oxo-dGTP pyrophosphatase MutT, NUDIX family [Marinospirillum celere]|uniref:8-oxo-dGTP pyrophosphatase MutT, NUDIX family n=1 Tax=Marinospirillum celere TaxID=1122252 RepID=A0A1I1HLP2_9GAMM|nr:CoA pyrophosphatase [Marinospirillum celere]SFC22000.1 8-oxo-dGTP pyrophosphatase MutT, NUDIX family [Marinospirillum celere]